MYENTLYFTCIHSVFCILQSYGDIDVNNMVRTRLARSDSTKLARSGSKRRRNAASGSEKETSPAPSLAHQQSHSKTPTDSKKLQRLASKKLQEQWDKEIPVVSLARILKKNAPEWWMIALGLIGSMVSGAISPLFSIFFGKILGVFANPPDKVFPLVHPWAGLFLALAFITAIANLSKVCLCLYVHALSSHWTQFLLLCIDTYMVGCLLHCGW